MDDNNRYKIFWDEENKIARAWAKGTVDDIIAEDLRKNTIEMADKHGDQINWICNLSEIKNSTSKARKIMAETTTHPSIHKYALVGASVFVRTVSNFILAVSGQKNASHFKTEVEALQWIKEI